MSDRSTDFLPDPIDYGVLRTILATMEQGAIATRLRYMIVELHVMIEEAERSPRPEAWDGKIRERWTALEQVVRASRSAAPHH
ncbi:hypothetical protein SLNSH_00685 [Alsobacter soli]|uniref:Uncharacterized protein n=1 Tax=Alsobacter soli TaxID=2109933 RepID=A0A2T1HZ88_9HYPH|nr:hypothetical protein [Alsobacter soli]PSC06935.1 hypothetical protein SLNSH_00685 [Alsobacter soli]